MTPEKCHLKVNRLIVSAPKGVALDLEFHAGVNIIRGENGSGKSTIMDFLFFVLGGDYTQWKPEAARCHCVLAEITINDSPVVLRRYVSDKSMQAMHIFWGSYSEMEAAPETDWNAFPFNDRINNRNRVFPKPCFLQ